MSWNCAEVPTAKSTANTAAKKKTAGKAELETQG